MKLLLASQGITNKSIENKFFEMVGKKPEEMVLAYIPTAVQFAKTTDKRWMIRNLSKLDKMGIGQIDIVEITAVNQENWLKRLEVADVIYVEGGATKPLIEEARKVGFDRELPELLKNRVYFGCSAGSIMMGQIGVGAPSDDSSGFAIDKGFGFVDFSIRPHAYRKDRAQFTDEIVADLARKFQSTFYFIDDDTAVAVEDSKVEVISEGKWKKFE